MRRAFNAFVCVVVLAMGVADAMAQPEDPPLRGIYARIANELQLNDEERARLAVAAAARKEAEAAWDAEHRPRLDELSAQAAEARDAGDTARMRELLKQRAEIRAERAQLEAQHEKAALALLTPEQRERYVSYELCEWVRVRLQAANLTPEQVAEIRHRCDRISASVYGASEEHRQQLLTDLRNIVENEILTPEQREQVAGK